MHIVNMNWISSTLVFKNFVITQEFCHSICHTLLLILRINMRVHRASIKFQAILSVLSLSSIVRQLDLKSGQGGVIWIMFEIRKFFQVWVSYVILTECLIRHVIRNFFKLKVKLVCEMIFCYRGHEVPFSSDTVELHDEETMIFHFDKRRSQ